MLSRTTMLRKCLIFNGHAVVGGSPKRGKRAARCHACFTSIYRHMGQVSERRRPLNNHPSSLMMACRQPGLHRCVETTREEADIQWGGSLFVSTFHNKANYRRSRVKPVVPNARSARSLEVQMESAAIERGSSLNEKACVWVCGKKRGKEGRIFSS